MSTEQRALRHLLAAVSAAPLPVVRTWLRGGSVSARWARKLEAAVVQIELTRAELGPKVRLPALPFSGSSTPRIELDT